MIRIAARRSGVSPVAMGFPQADCADRRPKKVSYSGIAKRASRAKALYWRLGAATVVAACVLSK